MNSRIIKGLGLVAITSLSSVITTVIIKPSKDDVLEQLHRDNKELIYIVDSLNQELKGWRDHSSRMKKIIGVEHEGDITWVDKVTHPIDTKALNRMKISKR